MSIIIGGDIMPSGIFTECLKTAEIERIFSTNLLRILEQADYRLFNLELPLTDTLNPIKKTGLNKSAPTMCTKGLRRMGVDLVNLANNHCMDQGKQGLQSTFKALIDEGIAFVGAGNDLHSASIPFVFRDADTKYGVYSCAEHEFSIAQADHPGANPINLLDSFESVNQLKEKCDYVIVLYHGGKEYYQYPSPQLQKVCRVFIEKGADLVICQHSHCIGCEEKYMAGTIIYGQGDFLSVYPRGRHITEGLLIQVNNDRSIHYIPIINQGNRLEIADNELRQSILSSYEVRSEEIKKPGLVDKKYNELSRAYLDRYLITLSGIKYNVVFRLFNKLSRGKMQHIISEIYRKRNGLDLRNFIECEAHRELLLQGLFNKYEENS